MKITEHRTKEILNWLDDKAADHALLFEKMTLHRDAAALIRQLQAAEQEAWQAGLDAGREQGNAALRQAHKDYGCELADPNGTIWDHAANLQREVEALRKALRDLLDDTQHKNHNCGDEWCPVANARALLRDQEEV